MTVKSMPLRKFFLDVPVTCFPDEVLFTYFLFFMPEFFLLFLIINRNKSVAFLLLSYFLRTQLYVSPELTLLLLLWHCSIYW